MDAFPDFAPFAWVLLACAALFVGVAKTALPGVSTLSVAIFAAILPAKASSAALLLLFIVGDIFALLMYRRHADWPALVKLAPAVLVGLLLGAAFLTVADDGWVKRAIGAILLLLIGFTAWQRRFAPRVEGAGGLARVGYGTLGGFTTTVANAGGPVMALYFLAAKFPVKTFLGTAAWFFASVNIAKLPIALGLGLVTPGILLLDAVLLPGVVIGAFVGRWAAARIVQSTFDRAVLLLTVLGSAYLILS